MSNGPGGSNSTTHVPTVDIEAWYHEKDLGADWTSRHFPHWMHILAPSRDRNVRVLEIGSYEGRSALFFLNYLPRSSIVCIDAWDPSVIDRDIVGRMPVVAGVPDQMEVVVQELTGAQARFDRNVAEFGCRVTKIVGWSKQVLAELGVRGELFDVIYVDGDHTAAGAYADSILAWPLLAAGGIMIFDDYAFMLDLPTLKRPQAGIDRFLQAIHGRFDELHRDYQVVIRARSTGL